MLPNLSMNITLVFLNNNSQKISHCDKDFFSENTSANFLNVFLSGLKLNQIWGSSKSIFWVFNAKDQRQVLGSSILHFAQRNKKIMWEHRRHVIVCCSRHHKKKIYNNLWKDILFREGSGNVMVCQSNGPGKGNAEKTGRPMADCIENL